MTTADFRRVLVTGAGGFVGQALCPALEQRGLAVRRALRLPDAVMRAEDVAVGDIDAATSWDKAVDGIDAVIHLAARTHVMRDAAADPLAEYRRTNVEATRALALAAVRAGVRRFIYVSSVKVNGERTLQRPYTEQDTPRPEDNYGITKWEAEQALAAAAAGSRMQTVVLRPPLIYGPGVKGNFLSLMRAIQRGLPLPLSSVRNQRSLLYVGNLVDAITLCLDHPAAAGKTFLVADDLGVATPDLVSAIAHALKQTPRLLPCPAALLRLAGVLTGKSGAVSRLLGSLEVDASRIRDEIGWRPASTLEQGLSLTAEWYYRQSGADTKN